MKENTINFKENLNNKLNLPTTWTKKKMASLLLMGWLSVNGAEGGKAFENCLTHYNETFYNSLLKFDFTANLDNMVDGKKIRMDCNGSSCSMPGFGIDCTKIAQTIFCENIFCGGIVSDTPIASNTTTGNCATYNFDTIINKVKYTHIIEFDTAEGYANTYICSSNDLSLSCSDLSCFWDNGGWTCANYDAIVNVPSNFSVNCFLQWQASWPGPADKNPYPFTLTTTNSFTLNTLTDTSTNSPTLTTILTSVLSPSVPLDSSTNTPNLTEKIAIPVGTVVGVATVSGVAYYLVRKRKKKNNTSVQGPNLELAETNQEADAHEIVEEDKEWEFTVKKQELENLINQIKNKIGKKLEVSLETLLDTQAEITKGNDIYDLRQNLREVKEKLQKKLSLKEINEICQKQNELIQLQAQGQQLSQIQIPPK